jgi:hypothetical protein
VRTAATGANSILICRRVGDHTDVYFSRSQQADFERFKKALDKMMDESHRTAKGGSGAEELERYARLLEKGHITKEEFNQKKRQILEG